MSSTASTTQRRQHTPGRSNDSTQSANTARAGSTTAEAITLSDNETDDEASHSSIHPVGELMQTTVTVQYGPELKNECTMHLAMLMNHSSKLAETFAKAEKGRRQLVKAKAMRQKIKELLPPLTSAEKFDQEKAAEIIERAMKRFPIPCYQNSVTTVMTKFVDDLFQDNKNLIDARISRRAFPASHVLQRIQQMQPAAVLSVVQRLHDACSNIKIQENKKAAKDPLKAAAQKRILLPEVEAGTIEALTDWVYHKKLTYKDADHLCKIWLLAHHMGVDELTDLSFRKLNHGYCNAIMGSRIDGIALHDLLNKTSTDGHPLSDVVPAVFKFVLHFEVAPAALQNLVIAALVASVDDGDLRAFEQVLPAMRPDLKDSFCRGLGMRFIQFKKSMNENSIKKEVNGSPDNRPMEDVKADVQGTQADATSSLEGAT